MTVNEKIRMMREMKDWTQLDMAERLHMSLNSYAKLERGESKLYLEKLEKISDIFEIDMIDLLSLNKQGLINLTNQYGDIHGDNAPNNIHYYAGVSDKQQAFEIEKLKLMLEHKDELLKQKDEIIKQLSNQIKLLEKIHKTHH